MKIIQAHSKLMEGKWVLLLSGMNKNKIMNVNISMIITDDVPLSLMDSRVCRFVRQHDLFYEFLTVQEHLYYQAILRLGNHSEQIVRDRLVWVCFNSNCSSH